MLRLTKSATAKTLKKPMILTTYIFGNPARYY